MRKLVAALLLVLLAACQSTPHYTIQPPPYAAAPPPPPSKSVPVRPVRPVPNYAGTAGPLTPAGTGHYMDGMESDLRRILRGTPVARPGDVLALNLRNDALFEKAARCRKTAATSSRRSRRRCAITTARWSR